jgi:hypothetical protein
MKKYAGPWYICASDAVILKNISRMRNRSSPSAGQGEYSPIRRDVKRVVGTNSDVSDAVVGRVVNLRLIDAHPRTTGVMTSK